MKHYLLSAVFALVSCLAAPMFAGSPVSPALFTSQPAENPPEADEPEEEESAELWLANAEQALDLGRYRSARTDFRKVLREQPANQQAARGLAASLAAEGEYGDAVRALERALKATAEANEPAQRSTGVHLARLKLTLGDHDAVAAAGAELLKADNNDIDGILLSGLALHATGQYDAAEEVFVRAREVAVAARGAAWQIDRAKGRQPELADLWASAGECYFMLNRLHEANDCWGNALLADPVHLRSAAWMARLYIEQNHDSSAMVNYIGPTLKHNNFAADLHFWAANAHFFRWRGGEGLKSLEQCLRINPEHPQALAFRAQRLVTNDEYEAAARDYDRALKLNPRNMEALGAKALHAKTLGLDDLYAQAEAAVLAFNPKPARFFEIIADGLAYRHRYHEALPIYARALECNPKHWTAYTGQGRAALNKGDDVLGKKSLEIALDKDPVRNNLQTVNLLTLLDSYKNFVRTETPDGRWRLLVHKSEAAVLNEIYLEHLNTAFDALVKKYDFTPRLPLTIEAFHIHQDFEVRTVGITGLPALGACFGQLITLDSPSARPPGSYNWASTLRHELDHVWQIQISNGQVPRWLAEGLSVYEEKTTRPEWERHMEDRLFMHYHMDDIPPIKQFNEWFRDGSKILFAYYLGNVMLEFIDKKLGGMGAVRKMLEMFGDKKTPDEVFKACLNIEPEEFDRRFREYVRDERIAHLRMVPRVSPQRIEKLYFAYEDGVASRAELVELAKGYMQVGSRVDAELFLGLAASQGADKALGAEGATWHYTKAMLLRGDENVRAAERNKLVRGHLQTAMSRGLEDFQTYLMMAQFARADQDMEKVLHWLREANRAYPENAQPYAAMFQLFQATGQPEKAAETAEAWMRVDENNLDVRMWLIQNVYEPRRNWAKLADMALQAIHIAPLNPQLHTWRAFALRRLKEYPEAVKHFDYVRRLASGTIDEVKAIEVGAILDIAATWMQAGETAKCREALEQARKIAPDNPRIKTIESELEGGDEKEEDF